MTTNDDLTYAGSWSSGVLAYLSYSNWVHLNLTLSSSGQLVFNHNPQATFNYYRTDDGRYLLQNPADGQFVVGSLVTVDGQQVMRYDATADTAAATSFAIVFSQTGKPTYFTDDQGYKFSYYVDAYPWNPSLTDAQTLYGRTTIPDGYSDYFFRSRWMAPTLDAETLSRFMTDRLSPGDSATYARAIPWIWVTAAPFDFSGWHLVNCSWANASFGAANLAQCRLDGCNFDSAEMAGTDLSGAELTGGNLAHLDLTQLQLAGTTFVHQAKNQPQPFSFVGSTLDISILGNDWSYCNLKSATLLGLTPGINLANLQAQGSTLDDQVLDDAILSHANFQAASLVDVNLSGATLVHADFSPGSNGAVTNLTDASLHGADLQNANLQSAILVGCNLAGANLESADLTGAQLGGQEQEIGAAFSYAYMANTILDKTNLYSADFSYATFYGAGASVAETSTMEQTKFGNAYLAGLNLAGANLQGANFTGACMVNCDLSGVDLSPSDEGSNPSILAGASLQGANFTGANLAGANLQNAAVAFADGSITASHCDGYGSLSPAAPLTFGPTTGLDCNSIKSDTICPNGSTLEDNLESLGVSSCDDLTPQQWQEILTAPGAPGNWTAQSCAAPQ